ncbi:hypothetical protein BDL97_11G012900 [Sphagnum fallax]|nr:hypothetical protein BDL97_11G012900 [Sphagnum fallax]
MQGCLPGLIPLGQELEELRKMCRKETEEEKLQLKQEVSKVLDRVQKEVLAATQKHFDREMELQDLCRKERASHMKTIEEMMVLHNAETKRLKMEHMAAIDDCCHNHTSREAEWQDKEIELQKKISIAVEEKKHAYHELFNLQENLQEVEASLKVTQMQLAHVSLCSDMLQTPHTTVEMLHL